VTDYKKIDCHLHSEFSYDSEEKIENILKTAAERGLYAVALTDHCEMNAPEDSRGEPKVLEGLQKLRSLREPYSGGLIVLCGAEVGQATQNYAAANHFIETAKLDFILGSIHNTKAEEDFYFIDFSKRDPLPLYTAYLGEMLELIEWGRFDSLAHLTYPLRYITEKYGIAIDHSALYPQYDAILSLLAEKELALEVNTSSVKNGGGLCPDFTFIKRFFDLGGRRITFGSDSHQAQYIGTGIDNAREAALAAGFKNAVIYKNRSPIEVAL
jgi:histidinol-phosphatase (PHP family)